MRRTGAFIDSVGEFVYKIFVPLTFVSLMIPILIIIVTSFDPNNIIGRLPASAELSLKWYAVFMQDQFLTRGLMTSLIVAISCAFIVVIVGICTAYLMTRYDFRGKSALTELLMSPSLFPGVVIGLSFMYLFLGLASRQVLANLIIAHVVICFSLALRPLIVAFETFDERVEKSARTLGASPMRAFIEVTFPDIVPGVVAAFLYAFSLSLDDVSVAVFLTDAYTVTFPVAMLDAFRRTLDPRINVGCTFLFIMTLVVVLIIEKGMGLEKLVRSAYAR